MLCAVAWLAGGIAGQDISHGSGNCKRQYHRKVTATVCIATVRLRLPKALVVLVQTVALLSLLFASWHTDHDLTAAACLLLSEVTVASVLCDVRRSCKPAWGKIGNCCLGDFWN